MFVHATLIWTNDLYNLKTGLLYCLKLYIN